MKIIFSIFFILLITLILFAQGRPTPSPVSDTATPTPESAHTSPAPTITTPEFIDPISDFSSRITKKPFAVRISPGNSPVSPERFSGFHTGVDAEILPAEANTEVRIRAACDGRILVAQTASGYGGVVVKLCQYQGKAVTVVYGHLQLSSVKVAVGDQITAGDFLGVLGAGGTSQTDGERKHLHFAIHRGSEVNLAGYVSTSSQLSSWIDPVSVLSKAQMTKGAPGQ